MSSATAIIEAAPQELEGEGAQLLPAETFPSTLWRTDDPVEVIARASTVANALKRTIDDRNLTIQIRARQYVLVEGWTTLGSMVGVVPVLQWTRPLANGWEARVLARTLDGRTVGAGESQCTRAEERWREAEDFAIRSMAQTRAISRALRGPLGFVVALAGYEATPAEEMPPASPERALARPSAEPPARTERLLSARQRALIHARASEAGLDARCLGDLIRCALGMEPIPFASEEQARSSVDHWLERFPARLMDELLRLIASSP